ncbi:MAG TPA: AbrB/MazE/SpoVT family DNA-binding domain-containing protein [Chthoniobacterales bacterium]
MRLTSKGQVTIPKVLRKQYGLTERAEVEFEAVAEGVLVRPAAASRLRLLEKALRKARGSADAGCTTAGIMRLTRGED